MVTAVRPREPKFNAPKFSAPKISAPKISAPKRQKQRSARAVLRALPFAETIAAIVLASLVAMAIAPQLFAPIDPLLTNPFNAFQPPSLTHWFGTDQLGRDEFARVVHGARASLTMGVGATLVGLAGGVVLGLLAGLSSGITDRVLSRVIDILFSFPELLLALVAVTVLGVGLPTLLIAIGLGSIPGYARALRSQVILVRTSGYTESAVLLGLKPSAIALRHVLPNSLGPVLVLATIGVGTAIIFGAALSFVGLGAQPPTPEWGLMLSESRNYLAVAWWLGFWPGAFLAATVISVTIIGRALQRRFLSAGGTR